MAIPPCIRSRVAITIGVATCIIYVFASIIGAQRRANAHFDESRPSTTGKEIPNVEAAYPESLAPDVVDSATESPPPESTRIPENAIKLDWLKSLEGSPDVRFPFRFTRQDIVVRQVPRTQHSSLTHVGENLFPDFQQIESFESAVWDAVNSVGPLVLEIPVTPKPDASHILLGSASTVERLEASIPFFERWLAHTGARLIVMVKGQNEKAPDRKAMTKLEFRMRDSGMNVTLVEPLAKKDNFIQRYFSLVKVLYEHRDANTKWIGFVDDDTFFVSMTALVERLATFDHTRNWYLGALSEEWWTVIEYGLIGMGGAGVFLTLPVAELVSQNYKECKKHTRKIFGDHMIYDCILRHSETRLVHVDGLYQLDLHGDRSGVFESGRIILTLHHWKEGYWSEDGEGLDGIRHPRWFPMDKMALVQDVCGDTCFLQRIQFGNDTILTNGYSIASYPTGALRDLPVGKVSLSSDGNLTSLDQMERTWVTQRTVNGSVNDGWDHYLGPCRPALQLEVDKIHWRLMDASKDVDGSVRQYFRRVGRDGRIDEWVELHFIREKPA